MTIKIVFPSDGSISTGCGTKVFNDKGDEVKNVTTIDVRIAPDEIIMATIDVAFAADEMDNIHAMLGTKTLKEIAESHGFNLVPISETPLDPAIKRYAKSNSESALGARVQIRAKHE